MAEKNDFLNANGYEFHETSDGVTMILGKKVDDKALEIWFKSRQPGSEADSYGYSDDEFGEASYTDFTV